MASFNRDLVVLDVDGVLLDFYRGAGLVAQEIFQRPMTKVSNRSATKHRYGLSESEYQQLRTAMLSHPNGWINLPTLPGAVEAVEALHEAGKRILFLTSCGQRMEEARRQNLANLGLLDYCRLMCVEDGQDNKGRILRDLRPAAFVDDHEKMLAQAPFVPERVFIDHGCDPQEDEQGLPMSRLDYVCVPSLEQWATRYLKAPHHPLGFGRKAA